MYGTILDVMFDLIILYLIWSTHNRLDKLEDSR